MKEFPLEDLLLSENSSVPTILNLQVDKLNCIIALRDSKNFQI